MGRATFSNIEHQNIEWMVDTIRPWLIRFEQEYNRKLFRKTAIFYTKHVIEGMMRGDLKYRYDAYAVGRNWGWLSADDVRELEDMNPLDDDIGDLYLIPANMQPAQIAANAADAAELADETEDATEPPETDTEEDPETESGDQAVAKHILRATAERVIRAEAKAFSSIGAECYAGVRAKIVEWMHVEDKIAGAYCSAALQLTLIAAERDISHAELQERKVELLLKTINGGKHAKNA
jgi:hypothetical protein